MKQVDEGLTSPDKLLFYLEEYFDLPLTDHENTGIYDQITHLENHKGNWVIHFKGKPSEPLLLCILALFETKLSYDGVDKIVFNAESSSPIEVEQVAGCLDDGTGIDRVMAAYKSVPVPYINIAARA